MPGKNDGEGALYPRCLTVICGRHDGQGFEGASTTTSCHSRVQWYSSVRTLKAPCPPPDPALWLAGNTPRRDCDEMKKEKEEKKDERIPDLLKFPRSVILHRLGQRPRPRPVPASARLDALGVLHQSRVLGEPTRFYTAPSGESGWASREPDLGPGSRRPRSRLQRRGLSSSITSTQRR